MFQKTKRAISDILDGAETSGLKAKIFIIFMTLLIFLNIIAVALETVEPLYSLYAIYFHAFETFSIFVFTIEHILRIWTCNLHERFAKAGGVFKYMVTPMALVDLVSILPFYLSMFAALDLRTVKALRLLRLFRIFKLGRYSTAFEMFKNVIRNKREELVLSVFMIFIALIIASTLMYFLEHEAQPERFSNIPAAMWWGIVTLATIGYGDVYPITPLGKFFGAIVALFGIAMFAIPTGLFASGFAEQIHRTHERSRICPHCGKHVD